MHRTACRVVGLLLVGYLASVCPVAGADVAVELDDPGEGTTSFVVKDHELTDLLRVRSDQTSSVAGDLGVGTADPKSDLHVVGGTNFGQLYLCPNNAVSGGHSRLVMGEDDDGTYGFSLGYNGPDDTVFFSQKINTTHSYRMALELNPTRLGVNTANPGATLHVNGETYLYGNSGVGTLPIESHRLSIQGSTSAVRGSALYVQNTSSSGIALVTRVESSDVNTVLAQHGSGDFLYCDGWYPGDGDPEWHRVIRLMKDGTVECKVMNITGGSDLAEPFNVSDPENLEPGMVVSIDSENPGSLRCATAAYDRCVAGVVSGAGGVKPGVMMRQTDAALDGQHPVALTGRVYCWADAGYGGIQPGDLLTTSATPGHAMRVTEHDQANGAVLGKAMTTLEEGRGLVLVLVALQ